MSKIILDAQTLAKLCDLREPLELCDETGAVLAYVTPVPALDESLYEKAEEPYLSPEEMRRREKGPDYTTAEVLEYLRKL
jgi:hypothetical protein